MKLPEVFQSFIAQKSCFLFSTFCQPIPSEYLMITWNNINFQSSTSLLKNTFRNPFLSTPFAKTFRNPRPSLKLDEIFQSFTARIDCLKNSIFSQFDSVYEITWNNSKFPSSTGLLKQFRVFANRFRLR